MSHEFYLNQWRSAMEDLLDVLQIECPNAPSIDISGKEGQTPHIVAPSPVPSNPSPTPPVEKKAPAKAAPGKKGDKGAEKTNFIPYPTAFDHFASVYLRYLGIYKKLEDCYDQIVHPQKRRDIKIVLETVMGRIVQLRAELSKVTNDGLPSSFVNLEDMLLKMQLPASFASVSVPRYFVEPLTMESESQDKKAKMEALLLENSAKAVLGDDKPSAEPPKMSREVAIRIIQRHERGRQAAAKAQTLKEIQLDAARRTVLHESKRAERKSAAIQYRDPLNQAAATIQRYYRGFHARQSYRMKNKDELTFIGMRAPNKPKLDALDAIAGADAIRQQRKLIQTDHEVKYVAALSSLEQDVILQDGPQIKEAMWEARYNWWIEEREKTGKFPESFDGFYAKLNPAPVEEPKEEAKKGKEKAKKEEPAKEKGKEDKDDKKKKAEEPPPVDPRPTTQSLLAPPEMVTHITEILQRYAGLWSGLNDSETNPNQTHDEQLAKSKLRPMVEESIRLKVDADLLFYLENIRLQAVAALEAASSGKKKKGKKKGSGEKKEKKKKSGSAKKDKKGGEKKKKCCEGEKICAEAEMTPELMAKELIGMGVLQRVPAQWPSVSSFIGESNMLGSAYEAAGMALEPSMSQLRDCVTQFAVLPLGCQYVKNVAPPTSSLLFFGPQATGKTTLSRAIAKDSGAIWLDLSPRVVDSFTATKQDIAKLMHMTFTVAKEFAPAVIYIDEVERIFAKKKKDATDNAPKLKASLLSHRDQLQPTDRVLIVGNSRAPQTAELNELLALFGEQVGGKVLQTPCPDYDTRFTLWRHFIDSRLRGFCSAPAASDEDAEASADDASQSESPADVETDARRKTLEQRLKELNLMEQHAETTEKLVINPDVVAGIGIERSVYPPLELPTSELLTCTTLSRNAGFNLSTLAFVSEGYTAGSISQAVQETLSNRRMARLQRNPKIEISEFLDQLCKTPFAFRDDIMQIREWAGVATGDAERRKTREAERAAAAEAAEAAKKKKKK